MIAKGSTEIKNVYKGGALLTAVYKGATKIWPTLVEEAYPALPNVHGTSGAGSTFYWFGDKGTPGVPEGIWWEDSLAVGTTQYTNPPTWNVGLPGAASSYRLGESASGTTPPTTWYDTSAFGCLPINTGYVASWSGWVWVRNASDLVVVKKMKFG